MHLYPLTFEPMLKTKVWGGRRLERFGKRLPSEGAVGESWEIADLDDTAESGGGGGAAHSVIDAGPMAGKTIRDVIKRYGGELLGQRGLVAARSFGYRGDPAFPLLIKYLDAGEHLSVQTHPSPTYAARHDGAKLKTESWYVLDAEATERPDGVGTNPTVFVGLKPGVTKEALRRDASDERVLEHLDSAVATPGDCWTLPSGTVHALGAGVLVAEVQTPSDTTFRLYDWRNEYGRPERETHVDEALSCIDFTATADSTPKRSGVGRVADTSFYTIDRVDAMADGSVDFGLASGACTVVMVIGGEGEIHSRDGSFDPVALPLGRTSVVPAACAGVVTAKGSSGFKALVIKIGAG